MTSLLGHSEASRLREKKIRKRKKMNGMCSLDATYMIHSGWVEGGG